MNDSQLIQQRDANDKPSALWLHHAQQRRHVLLGRIRAALSMAGFRDSVMLRHIKPNSRILDVGCGAGRILLNNRGVVAGIEPIKELADAAAKVYPFVKCCKAEEMPFIDDFFDAVVSTDIFGHIPNADKRQVINQMFRVLKPGGVTIHVAETESSGWLANQARKEPAAYQKAWVDDPDHHNLEPVEILRLRLTVAGFCKIQTIPIQPIIPECGTIYGLLREHKNLPAWLAALRAADKALSANGALRELTSLALTPVAALVNRFGSRRSGLGTIVIAHKR